MVANQVCAWLGGEGEAGVQGNSQISLLDKWIHGQKEKRRECARVSVPVSLILVSSFLPIPFSPRNRLIFTHKLSFREKHVFTSQHTELLCLSVICFTLNL